MPYSDLDYAIIKEHLLNGNYESEGLAYLHEQYGGHIDRDIRVEIILALREDPEVVSFMESQGSSVNTLGGYGNGGVFAGGDEKAYQEHLNSQEANLPNEPNSTAESNVSNLDNSKDSISVDINTNELTPSVTSFINGNGEELILPDELPKTGSESTSFVNGNGENVNWNDPISDEMYREYAALNSDNGIILPNELPKTGAITIDQVMLDHISNLPSESQAAIIIHLDNVFGQTDLTWLETSDSGQLGINGSLTFSNGFSTALIKISDEGSVTILKTEASLGEINSIIKDGTGKIETSLLNAEFHMAHINPDGSSTVINGIGTGPFNFFDNTNGFKGGLGLINGEVEVAGYASPSSSLNTNGIPIWNMSSVGGIKYGNGIGGEISISNDGYLWVPGIDAQIGFPNLGGHGIKVGGHQLFPTPNAIVEDTLNIKVNQMEQYLEEFNRIMGS